MKFKKIIKNPWVITITAGLIFFILGNIIYKGNIQTKGDYSPGHVKGDYIAGDQVDGNKIETENLIILKFEQPIEKPKLDYRKMNNQIGQQLIKQIPKSAKVIVSVVFGDTEAFDFGQQVLVWLKKNGYANVSGVDQVSYNQPVYQQLIKKKSDSEYEIIIGTYK